MANELGYKKHKAGSNVEKLHREFDKRGRASAMKLGLKLGYTEGGCAGWISFWAAQDKKAVKSKGKRVRPNA